MKRNIKRMKIFTFIFFMFISYINAQTINIEGSLKDSISKSELPFGTLSLKNINDSLVSNILANDKGHFIFKDIPFNKGMYISTNYLGYNKRIIQIISNDRLNINLGKILLVPNEHQLEEVTVEGDIDCVVKKLDRKVYIMDEGKIATARTVLDLFRTLPGVVVDNDGNIRYKGSEAIIYVDDQPLNFQFPNIEMIPVDKVDKIELIDASMYLGGDGQGGIINIRFKRVNRDGVSGVLSSKVSTILFKEIDKSKEFLNVNYKNKKFTFFLNTSIENTFTESNSITIKNIDIPSGSFIQKINSTNKYQRSTNFNNLGVIYWPTSNTKLYLSSGFYTLKFKSDFESTFTENNSIDLQLQNSYIYKESSKRNQLYEGVNFSYWHKFDTINTYLKIFGNFNIYKIFSTQNSYYKFNELDAINTDSIYCYDNNRRIESNDVYLNIFYNHSISKNTRWNLSYNLSFGLKDTTSKKHYIYDNVFLPKSQFDANKSQRHNLSWRIGTKLKKWTIDGGVKIVDYFINGNYTRYNQNLQDTILLIKKNYLKILPSATFTYEINENKDIKLTLSKSSILPNFNQLSDYIERNELYNWYSGNSRLEPVDFYSVYLGYNYNITKWNVSAEVFYNYTNNEVANLSIPLTSLLILTRPENIAQKSNVGIDLSTWYKLNKHFNFSISSTFFYLSYDMSTLKNTAIYYNLSEKSLTKEQYGFNFKCNFEYKLKEYYTMFYFNYSSKKVTFDGYYSPWINSSVSVSKKFFNKKLRLSIGINNIFNDMIEHNVYSSSFGVISNKNSLGTMYDRFYIFSIKYNFNKGDRGTRNFRIGG